MAKFSTQVESFKQQTNLLRDNVTQLSGEDCNNLSIGQCASVLKKGIAYGNEVAYNRPKWYPNITEIINSAPDVVVDETTYYPYYIALVTDTIPNRKFYKNSGTSETAANYHLGYAGEAFIFSDDVDNDVANINENTLKIATTDDEVTSTVSVRHRFNSKKAYCNPDKLYDYGVYWIIVYTTKPKTLVQAHVPDVIEIVTSKTAKISSDGLLNSFGMTPGTTTQDTKHIYYLSPPLKSLIFQEGTTGGLRFGTGGYVALRTVTIPNSYAASYYNDGRVPIGNTSYHSFSGCYSLKELNLPENATALYGLANNETAGCALRNITIPKNVTIIEKCFNSFALSNVVFKGSPGVIKTSFRGNLSNDNGTKFNYLLDKLVIPEGVTTMEGCFRYSICLEELILPSTLETFTNNIVDWCSLLSFTIPESLNNFDIYNATNNILYITLYPNFDKGFNFTRLRRLCVKWFEDFCTLAKDFSDTNAHGMVFGTTNISKMENIWLLVDPNDKRNLTFENVNETTEGAITVLEYLTTYLNWTIS